MTHSETIVFVDTAVFGGCFVLLMVWEVCKYFYAKRKQTKEYIAQKQTERKEELRREQKGGA